jgi:serine/threonine protein phosphatase PrpC
MVEEVTAKSVGLAMSGCSDTGRVRESNEDSYAINETAGVAVVADGMGGHAAGEVASGMATKVVVKALADVQVELAGLEATGYEAAAERIGQVISGANGQIIERSLAESDKRGMGTTIDAVVLVGHSAYVAHVGDSRVYWIREGTGTPVTRDHSLAATLVDSGRLTAAEAAPLEGVLVRALGITTELAVDVVRLEIRPGDALLLCTDGLWRYFPDPAELASMVASEGAQAAGKLVAEAVSRGGEDNATAVVIMLGKPEPSSKVAEPMLPIDSEGVGHAPTERIPQPVLAAVRGSLEATKAPASEAQPAKKDPALEATLPPTTGASDTAAKDESKDAPK